MPCQRIPQGVALPTDNDGNPLPGYNTIEECARFDSGSFRVRPAPCQRIDVVATVTNNFGVPALLKASGGADDDVIINGEIYQDGQFPFSWGAFGSPCGSSNATNGSHGWSYEVVLQSGDSVTFGAKDNGFGGDVGGSWTLETCF